MATTPNTARRLALTLLAAAASVLGAAATAQASFVRLSQPATRGGDHGNAFLVLAAFPGETNDVRVDFASGRVTVRDSAGLVIGPNARLDAARCRYDSGSRRTVTCRYDAGEGRVTVARVNLQNGNDRLVVGGDRVLTPRVVVASGLGNDSVAGGPRGDGIGDVGGYDVIAGGGGDDVVFAGPGNDRVAGGPGNDLLRGGAGYDRLLGEDGNDRLHGDDGHDFLFGGPGLDLLVGGRGLDRLDGRLGDFRRG